MSKSTPPSRLSARLAGQEPTYTNFLSTANASSHTDSTESSLSEDLLNNPLSNVPVPRAVPQASVTTGAAESENDPLCSPDREAPDPPNLPNPEHHAMEPRPNNIIPSNALMDAAVSRGDDHMVIINDAQYRNAFDTNLSPCDMLRAMTQIIEQNNATIRADNATIRADIAGMKADLVSKTDIADMKADIVQVITKEFTPQFAAQEARLKEWEKRQRDNLDTFKIEREKE